MKEFILLTLIFFIAKKILDKTFEDEMDKKEKETNYKGKWIIPRNSKPRQIVKPVDTARNILRTKVMGLINIINNNNLDINYPSATFA